MYVKGFYFLRHFASFGIQYMGEEVGVFGRRNGFGSGTARHGERGATEIEKNARAKVSASFPTIRI